MIGNCLFGALYAHLKDLKNTKVLKVPACVIGDKALPHFVCYNFVDNTITHFVKNVKNPKCGLLFGGHFETMNKCRFDILVNKKLRAYLAKQEEKIRSSYNDTYCSNYLGWNDIEDKLPTYEGGLPYTKRVPFVQFTSLGETVEIKTVKFNDDKTIKIPDGFYYWRYITPDVDNALYSSYNINI